MPNWKTLEAKDRLLAALVAAHPDKKLLDYRRIATYFGEGTTYDSIEGQFRIIRREAQRLASAVESGEHAPAPPRGSNNAVNAGTNGLQGSARSKPKSKPKTKPKAEPLTSSDSAGNGANFSNGVNSINNSSNRARTVKKPTHNISSGLTATNGVISGRITKAQTPPAGRKAMAGRSEQQERQSQFNCYDKGGIDGAADAAFSSSQPLPSSHTLLATDNGSQENFSDGVNGLLSASDCFPSSPPHPYRHHNFFSSPLSKAQDKKRNGANGSKSNSNSFNIDSSVIDLSGIGDMTTSNFDDQQHLRSVIAATPGAFLPAANAVTNAQESEDWALDFSRF